MIEKNSMNPTGGQSGSSRQVSMARFINQRSGAFASPGTEPKAKKRDLAIAVGTAIEFENTFILAGYLQGIDRKRAWS